MTAARTASQIGRRNRANGAAAERQVARYLTTWWPDACRAVRNTTPDPGDVDCTSPSLWWSVKNCEQERLAAWMDELVAKQQGRIGLLVVRRRGVADPGRWWCWLTLRDLGVLLDASATLPVEAWFAPVRMELRDVIPLLLAYTRREVRS